MTIQTINNHMEDNQINTAPEYQREIVWKEINQKELIHTLLDGFPMPSLNFCIEGTDSHNHITYECMDGKNRLNSIRLFMTDKLTTKDGYKFSDLSKAAIRAFNSIEVTICIFTGLSQDERQDYFRRIQNGVILSQPELIWSQDNHPLVKRIKVIRAEILDKISCIWDTKRYNDIQLAMNIVHMINGKYPVLKSTSITHWLHSQSTSKDYTDISCKIKLVLIKLHSIIIACPPFHQKLKVPFTLDLAKWIISNDFRTPSIEIISGFIGDIGQLILDNNYIGANDISSKYFTLLNKGSNLWNTVKMATARFQLVSELFV